MTPMLIDSYFSQCHRSVPLQNRDPMCVTKSEFLTGSENCKIILTAPWDAQFLPVLSNYHVNGSLITSWKKITRLEDGNIFDYVLAIESDLSEDICC